jgi:hypothetical protein
MTFHSRRRMMHIPLSSFLLMTIFSGEMKWDQEFFKQSFLQEGFKVVQVILIRNATKESIEIECAYDLCQPYDFADIWYGTRFNEYPKAAAYLTGKSALKIVFVEPQAMHMSIYKQGEILDILALHERHLKHITDLLEGTAETSCSSIQDAAILKIEWLNRVFPSINNCTPANFYFNQKIKRSNNGILEKNGYRAYKINKSVATYRIRKKFFGFNATEIAIPSSTDSVYTVTVHTCAKCLAEVIKSQTGHKPSLYNKAFKAQSAVAYLVAEETNKTTFVCFTFDGGF